MIGKSLRIGVAALLAAGALTGCGGGPLKTGAAAVVGDDRITVGTLDEAVREGREEFGTDPVANRIRASLAAQFPEFAADGRDADMRRALALLVNFRVADRALERAGVPLTEGQVDAVEAELERAGGAGPATLAYGLPRSYSREMARFLAARTEVVKRYGATGDPTNPMTRRAAVQAEELFVRTARELDIRVNPRFGEFDERQSIITPAVTRLSSPDAGIAP
ncbi:hypothetical protein [Spirillospora albida]|uniref:hypothetical protein n=1 Tax=Spirillospora albida TaxID=58123 RepID=UPI0004BF3755|nr:hypothetical protein [Spirillospora albida]